MFEADPNLWLQMITLPGFNALMRFMSWMGNTWFYMPAILLLVFGVRLRAGMGVLLALILVAFATDCIKQGFGLPRPSEVDARVLDKGREGRYLVADGAAESFWSLPRREAIETVRASGRHEYGFVSGHTSAAVALALGLAFLFRARKAWIWGLAILWPLMMGISRMYLGRHFLADVLGGLVVGVAGVLLAVALMRCLAQPWPRARLVWGAAFAGACAAGLAAWRLPWIDPAIAGEVAGTLLCIGVLTRLGWPQENTGLARRTLRVVCALALGYGVTWAFGAAYEAGGWPERHLVAFFFGMGGFATALLGAVAVARWLGLYRPPLALPVQSMEIR